MPLPKEPFVPEARLLDSTLISFPQSGSCGEMPGQVTNVTPVHQGCVWAGDLLMFRKDRA